MTIIAGFRCSGGIVLCADTQETVGEISKRNVPKLRYESLDPLLSGIDLGVAFCGASNNGPFVDKIVDLAWDAAKRTTSLDDAAKAIEETIKTAYQEFGEIYQSGYCPEADLVYGIKMQGDSRLFSALGPIVNQQEEYHSGGIGYYMADFLTKRMYNRYLNIHQCVILAAYILFQAKEHVDGCGGESHIAILREEGPSGRIDQDRIDTITKNLELADHNLGKLLLTSADVEVSNEDFEKEFNDAAGLLKIFRNNHMESLDQWKLYKDSFDKMFGVSRIRDNLGLSPDSET